MINLPPYDTYPTISSDHIMLRKIGAPDIAHIVEISFYDGKKAATTAEAAEMQHSIDQNYYQGNSIHWAIIDISTNDIVGTCGYYRGFDNSAGELGCVLLPHFRGKGYMTAAMQLAIDFGKNEIRLNRIWAITTRQNDKAINLLERLGFIKTADLESDKLEYEFSA